MPVSPVRWQQITSGPTPSTESGDRDRCALQCSLETRDRCALIAGPSNHRPAFAHPWLQQADARHGCCGIAARGSWARGCSGRAVASMSVRNSAKADLPVPLGAGQRPRPRAGASELSQDLAGESHQRRGGKVVARIVRCVPVVRQMHRAMEAPAHTHELGQRRCRRFASSASCPVHLVVVGQQLQWLTMVDVPRHG